MERSSGAVTLASSGTALIASLSLMQWVAIISVLVAVMSLLINLIFKLRTDRRQDEKHRAEMRQWHEDWLAGRQDNYRTK